MDGNGRWAKKKHMPRYLGHKTGVEAVKKIIEKCINLKTETLTLFAFSSENWKRPKKEVSVLMDLFLTVLKQEIKRLHNNDVQLKIIGNVSAFSSKLQNSIQEAENLTSNNQGMKLMIAANYGGRWDIVQTTQKIARQVAAGQLNIDQINEQIISQHMSLSNNDPDLFIRTGGEKRISNFLLWNLAYTELVFTDVLWPDYSLDYFDQALSDYRQRQRRYGQTSEQVNKL